MTRPGVAGSPLIADINGSHWGVAQTREPGFPSFGRGVRANPASPG